MKPFPPAVLGASILISLAVACSPKTESKTVTAADAAAVAAANATTDAAAGAAAATSDAAAVDTSGATVAPEAIEALKKMSAYLQTLKSFEINADTTSDTVLDDGQLIQIGGQATYRVRRPNAFRLVIDTDRKKRTLYYDGKTFTLYSPRMKFYAQTEAPPTISETAAMIEDKYGVELPLADLFHWGTDETLDDNMTSGMHVGMAKVAGVECSQYAFREGGVDWQIFIQTGDKPLPRKIVITTRTDEARPQFTALLNWKENVSFDDATFAFKPTPESRRIQIVAVAS